MAQYLVPVADGGRSDVFDQADGIVDLYAAIDEIPANDSDYIYVHDVVSAAIAFKLKGGIHPGVKTGHVLRFRGYALDVTDTCNVLIRLYKGNPDLTADLITNGGYAGVDFTDALANYSYTFNEVDDFMNFFTDYDDLWVKIQWQIGGKAPSPSYITQVYLEIPDSQATDILQRSIQLRPAIFSPGIAR